MSETEQIEQAAENAPRITNETVAAHREEVLSSARKYILPLQHSKHQVVIITTGLFIAAVVAFFTYCTLALYRFQTTSTFMYRVTQVIPFPVAKAGNSFVAYENYLFELRHYMHFYETQEQIDFSKPENEGRLIAFKKRALEEVINNAYVKQLAKQNKVSVSEREVNEQIALVKSQNRLGGSDKVFEDVLQDYWGWSVDDFRRSLRNELLAQKVVSTLDKETHARAAAALAELKSGADFGAVAKKYSDDEPSKANNGEFGFEIDRTNRDLSAVTTSTLFKLQPGQYSEIINTGAALQIVKNLQVTNDKVRGAHIIFNFKDINTYLDDMKEKQKARAYIRV